jgi:hypothetical protein
MGAGLVWFLARSRKDLSPTRDSIADGCCGLLEAQQHCDTAFREWTLEDYREIARNAMMKNHNQRDSKNLFAKVRAPRSSVSKATFWASMTSPATK